MAEYDLLRGKVKAYPKDKNKGLVEITVGTYDKGHDTIYARVEQSMSGVYWLPEIGDVVEVEVPRIPGYEARIVHIHRPAGNAQCSSCWTEKNDVKQFKTRTGHTLTMNDTKDKTAITLHTAGGLELQLNDETQSVTLHGSKKEPVLLLDMKENTIKLASSKTLTLSCGGAAIEIDDKGNISIKAKGKLELSGQEISLNAKTKLTAKGQQVEISGSAAAKLSGQSKLEVSSSGVTQVKGSIVKLN